MKPDATGECGPTHFVNAASPSRRDTNIATVGCESARQGREVAKALSRGSTAFHANHSLKPTWTVPTALQSGPRAMQCDISFVLMPMRTLRFNESTDQTIRNNRNAAASFLELVFFQKIRRLQRMSIRSACSFSNADVSDKSLCPRAFHEVGVEPYRT